MSIGGIKALTGAVGRHIEHIKGKASRGWLILPGFLLFFSFLKLPAATALHERILSWEAVLSYAAEHHLQWGQDIIFTYGPLGYLISNEYWGAHFWPIFAWSIGFSLVLTIRLLCLLQRTTLPFRVVLYAVLPLLTIPCYSELGIDSACLFAITVLGVSSLPEERPAFRGLMVSGLLLGLLSLIKFTFFLYAIVALFAITAAHLFHKHVWPAGVVVGGFVAAFLAAWQATGQNLFQIGLWLRYSVEITSGYASAMALAPCESDWILGVLACLCLAGLSRILLPAGLKITAWLPRLFLLASGLFLAWKEGFVRADDVHVMVFVLYALLMAVTMPALLGAPSGKKWPYAAVTAAAIVFALGPLARQKSNLMLTIRTGAVPKLEDTFTALTRPVVFKHRLVSRFESRCRRAQLPRIAAIVGRAPVGVLSYDQHIAILNGFNYRPHPVFQSYSAYTPALLRLNADFFDSENAPKYVLWWYDTVDLRFPTLDDGRVLLAILGSYTPVTKEGDYVLWRRHATHGQGCSFSSPCEFPGFLDQWILIPTNATWMQIELHETWYGAVRKFLCRGSALTIEVRFEDGQSKKYRLLPGNALSGFVINPLFGSETDLIQPFLKKGRPVYVTAIRVNSGKGCFHETIHVVTEKIEGLPESGGDPDSNKSTVIPAPSPATAP